MVRAAHIVTVGFALVATACGEERLANPAFTVRDSMGITIAENASLPREGARDAWRLSAEPVLHIGAVEGDSAYQLFQVTDATRLSDGRVVIANSGTGELRFYNAAGRFLRRAGAKGAGPGEFQTITWIARTEGDTLLAHDTRLGRMTVISANGAVVRSFQLPAPSPSERLFGAGVFGDRHILAWSYLNLEERPSGLTQPRRRYYRVDPEGARADSIRELAGPERFIHAGADFVMVIRRPFAPNPQLAVGGNLFAFSTASTYGVELYGPDGMLHRIVRKDHATRPVTGELIESFKREQLAAAEGNAREQMEQVYRSMPFPEALPALGDLRFDDGDRLWVQDYRAPGDSVPRWSVFTLDGRLVAEVETPPRFGVLEIGEDYVLGRWRDDVEVEHVRLYALHRTH